MAEIIKADSWDWIAWPETPYLLNHFKENKMRYRCSKCGTEFDGDSTDQSVMIHCFDGSKVEARIIDPERRRIRRELWLASMGVGTLNDGKKFLAILIDDFDRIFPE